MPRTAIGCPSCCPPPCPPQLERFDQNTGVITATKATTAAALTKVSTTVERVMDNEKVASVAASVSQGL
jgi:hypothetical protein